MVTRHERTLHAHDQEARQFQQKDADGEYVADEVNVAWAPPVRPTAPDTPPQDPQGLDNRHHLDFVPRAVSTEHGNVEETLSPASSSTTPSSISLPSAVSRRGTIALASVDEEESNAAAMIAETASMSSTTHHRPRDVSMAAESVAIRSDSSHSSQHPPLDPLCHSGNQQHSSNGAIGPDVTIDMAIDELIPFAQPPSDRAVSPHQHRQDQSLPPNPIVQDPMPFSFSPMPDVDLDLSGFTFTPLGAQVFDLPQHQQDVQSPYPFSMAELDALSHFGQPKAQISRQDDAQKSGDALPDANNEADECNLPRLLSGERLTHASLILDSSAHVSLQADLRERLGHRHAEAHLPAAKVLQGFLSAYISSFHTHLRIIHLQTFDPRTTPSPLVLAMCSIGALYRLDRRRARHLYDIAVRSVETVCYRVWGWLLPCIWKMTDYLRLHARCSTTIRLWSRTTAFGTFKRGPFLASTPS